MTATDGTGATSTATQTIVVSGGGSPDAGAPAGQGPIARITGGPYAGAAPLAVYLDATTSGTADPNGWISAFAWDLGDGTVATDGYFLHAYTNPGSYTVELTATAGDGSTATTTQLVEVSGGPPLVFQPGFHQALRWSEAAPSLTTYRLRIPPGRAGDRVEVTFRSGDGPLSISAANLAPAGGDGALAGGPVALTFSGQPGFSIGSRTLVTSDPVAFALAFHEDVYASFEAIGNLAVSAIGLFPESYAEAGRHSLDPSLAGQTPHPQAIGVATIAVEAPPTRAAIALGDSITEGYVQSCVPWTPSCGVPPDDYRNCWTYVAEGMLGWPVLDAAVSGQGVGSALANLPQEVLAVGGVTDSISLLGTNDLGGTDTPQDIEGVLTQIFQALAPTTTVWGATLLPKDSAAPNLATIQAELTAVNGWLRGGLPPIAALADFQSVLWVSPSDPVDFAPGLGEDGIHPTIRGQLLLGQYAARQLAAGP